MPAAAQLGRMREAMLNLATQPYPGSVVRCNRLCQLHTLADQVMRDYFGTNTPGWPAIGPLFSEFQGLQRAEDFNAGIARGLADAEAHGREVSLAWDGRFDRLAPDTLPLLAAILRRQLVRYLVDAALVAEA